MSLDQWGLVFEHQPNEHRCQDEMPEHVILSDHGAHVIGDIAFVTYERDKKKTLLWLTVDGGYIRGF